MNKKIAEQIVDEIKHLKKGSKFSIREFLLKYGVKEEEMFGYYRVIFSKIYEVVEAPEEFVGATVGMPYNIPLIKR